MPKAPTDPRRVVELYLAGHSLNDVARILDVTSGTVLYHLKRTGTARRPRYRNGLPPTNKLQLPIDDIVRLYKSGRSTFEIARTLGCTAKTIADRLKRQRYPMRQRRDYKGINTGPDNSNWKGGRHMVPAGYVRVRHPTHKRGYDFEHRVVMAQELGRTLTATEHVHHLNGIRHDNRPENLVVLDASTHKREGWTLVKALQVRIKELEQRFHLTP